MVHAPPTPGDRFRLDLRLAEDIARTSVVAGRSLAAANTWSLVWLPFCHALGIRDPYLQALRDKIPILQVFALRYRTGEISKSGLPVRSGAVSDALLHVAQAFTRLGAPDPRFNAFGQLDSRLTSLYTAWRNADPPPRRVKPIPIQILHHAHHRATHAGTEASATIVDLAWLGFFFLLRPGEYCACRTSAPLRLVDIKLFQGTQCIPHLTCPIDALHLATFVSLTFDTQKNRTRGEVIAHGRSGHPTACPVATLIRRITHLRAHAASATTPLHSYWTGIRWIAVTPDLITATLRLSAAQLGPALGFTPSDINARALRAGGAMALLCARIDPNLIQMVGRWRSNAMFRYLHLQAHPLIQDLSQRMLTGGTFALLPDNDLPPHAAALLAQIPPAPLPDV
jgi:hypothetical protein